MSWLAREWLADQPGCRAGTLRGGELVARAAGAPQGLRKATAAAVGVGGPAVPAGRPGALRGLQMLRKATAAAVVLMGPS